MPNLIGTRALASGLAAKKLKKRKRPGRAVSTASTTTKRKPLKRRTSAVASTTAKASRPRRAQGRKKGVALSKIDASQKVKRTMGY